MKKFLLSLTLMLSFFLVGCTSKNENVIEDYVDISPEGDTVFSPDLETNFENVVEPGSTEWASSIWTFNGNRIGPSIVEKDILSAGFKYSDSSANEIIITNGFAVVQYESPTMDIEVIYSGEDGTPISSARILSVSAIHGDMFIPDIKSGMSMSAVKKILGEPVHVSKFSEDITDLSWITSDGSISIDLWFNKTGLYSMSFTLPEIIDIVYDDSSIVTDDDHMISDEDILENDNGSQHED